MLKAQYAATPQVLSAVNVLRLAAQSCPTVCNPMDCMWFARLLCPWDSPGTNTGVSRHALLQGNFLNPGIKPRSLTLQVDSLPSDPPGKPLLFSQVEPS